MEKIIGIDFDETLVETLDSALKFHNFQINGIPIQRNDIQDYYLHNIPNLNISLEDSMKRFNGFLDSKESTNTQLVKGTQEKLKNWKDKGYLLYLITARKDSYLEATEKLIKKYFPEIFDEKHIIFANHFTEKSRSKSEICQEINAKIMIEDNLQYAEELAKNNITTYLLKKPRNRQYQDTNPLIISINGREDIHL